MRESMLSSSSEEPPGCAVSGVGFSTVTASSWQQEKKFYNIQMQHRRLYTTEKVSVNSQKHFRQ